MLHNIPYGFIAALAQYNLEFAALFDGSTGYLSRTFGAVTDRKEYTFSVWVKLCDTTGNDAIMGAPGNEFAYNSNRILWQDNSGSTSYVITTQKQRDTADFTHYFWVYDSPNTSAKVYVNGAEVTALDTNVQPGLNADSSLNNAGVAMRMGDSTASGFLNGYIADAYFVDGQALLPTDFAETAANGDWVAKAYAGTYGTNGFHLPFDLVDNLGAATCDAGTESHVSTAGIYGSSAGTTTTDINLNQKLPNGATLTALGFQASESTTNINIGVVERTSAANFTFVSAAEQISHGGGSLVWDFVTLATPIVVPDTGDHYIAVSGDLTQGGNPYNITSGGDQGARNTSTAYTSGSFTTSAETNATRLVPAYKADKIQWGVNGTITQITGDTPTDNRCVLDALAKTSNITLSAGNLVATASSGTLRSVASTLSFSSGKYMFESLANNAGGASAAGIIIEDFPQTGFDGQVGNNVAGWQIDANTSTDRRFRTNSANVFSITDTAVEVGVDRWLIAADADSGDIWVGFWDNSASTTTWYDSSGTGRTTDEPGLGTNASANVGSGKRLRFAVNCTSSVTADVFFNSDDWLSTTPAGFLALSEANLPAISKDIDKLCVQAFDTEANILSAISTARSEFTGGYLTLMKNFDATESWSWSFSHNSSNETAIINPTATYQAFRALSGSNNWIATSIAFDSSYGTAGGSQAHTNGAATTVTHNLGNTRQVVILFPRVTGAVYLYHPEMDAGDLDVLNDYATMVANTSITNITANSFDIGSGVATGTYDYIVMAESSWIKLGKAKGNAATDGTFENTGVEALVSWFRGLTGSDTGYIYQWGQQSYNPLGALGTASGANNSTWAARYLDMNSNGVKHRSTTGGNIAIDHYTIHIGRPTQATKAR